MARDRKRAKQRRRGRGAPPETRAGAARAASPAAAGAGPAPEPPSPSVPLGSGLPSPVDHASGEVEEFDAALAARGRRRAPPPAPLGRRRRAGEFDERARERIAERKQQDEEAAPASDNGELAGADELEGASSTGALEEEQEDGGNGSSPAEVAARTGLEAPKRQRGAARAEPRAERQSLPARSGGVPARKLGGAQRTQWPDRRQTSQATAVVLGFVVIAGVYLGVADWIAQKIVNLVILSARAHERAHTRRGLGCPVAAIVR